MNVVLFCHSLLSDWNHGNAHFLRGVVTDLVRRGHRVTTYEAQQSWSVTNLLRERGSLDFGDLARAYPALDVVRYDPGTLDLDDALDSADLVLVHEWNEPALVEAIGRHRVRSRYVALFHDTHHRSVTRPEQMAAYDLQHYDGILAFGETVRQVYLDRGWARRVWTWHEAADTRVFKPLPAVEPTGDLVWIGNWGDDEREAELATFLLEPVRALGLRARVHGVRYPDRALTALREAGIEYAGWLPNYAVPQAFAAHRVTVHVPRRPYAEALRGVPTIRPFEALACGIPLVSAPWDDAEGLFRSGEDFLVARTGAQMQDHLRAVLADPELAAALVRNGLETIRARHTCAHRVDALLAIVDAISANNAPHLAAGGK